MGRFQFRRRFGKFNARKVVIDGIAFDSRREGERYQALKLRANAGQIQKLEHHPYFVLQEGFVGPDGKRIRPILYEADFRYYDNEMKMTVIEDVKGWPTPEYKLKKKMLLKQLKEGQIFVEVR